MRLNPPKLGPKPEDLDWGLSKEVGGTREELLVQGHKPVNTRNMAVTTREVTEKVCLRAIYSDGITARTRKNGKASNRTTGYHVVFRFDVTPHSMAMAFVIWEELQYGGSMREYEL